MGLPLNSLLPKLGVELMSRILCKKGIPPASASCYIKPWFISSLWTSVALVKTLVLIMFLGVDLNRAKIEFNVLTTATADLYCTEEPRGVHTRNGSLCMRSF